MEDKDWFWQEDSYKLDADSPLAISRSLWDGLAQSEADSRSLFLSTPTSDTVGSDRVISTLHKSDADASGSGHPDAALQEGSPRSKRRRMLLFPESAVETGIADPPFEAALDASSYGGHCGGMIPSCEEYDKYDVAVPSSPNTLWYLKNDDPHFSLDEVLEPHAHKWMARSFGENRVHVGYDPTKLVVPVNEFSGSCSDYEQQDRESEAIDYSLAPFPSPLTPGDSSYLGRRSIALHTTGRLKSVTPVAYPFALLKPCGAQGDVTLNDINERISMPPSRPPQLGCEDSARSPSQPGIPGGGSPGLSGKSVVALTKIHTEGNGTITIMRTRG